MASSNSIEDLIEDDFKMTINNKQYYVKIPDRQDKKVITSLSLLLFSLL